MHCRVDDLPGIARKEKLAGKEKLTRKEELSFCFVSFFFISFRCIPFRFRYDITMGLTTFLGGCTLSTKTSLLSSRLH